ncbi:MAG: hypothetical protein WC325_11305 [Candidatus Bathyarchaeia archaeon]
MKQYAFILLNIEKFWNRLCSQNQAGKVNHAFVRRGNVGPKLAQKLFFYVISPQKKIQGYADFVDHITGNADVLWKQYGHESLLNTYDEYKDFLQGRDKATFIRFTNLKQLPMPISAKKISEIVGVSQMPQMGIYITQETAQQLLEAGGAQL